MIDVRDRTIKPADPGTPYITLSYRWAKKADGSDEASNDIPTDLEINHKQDCRRKLPDPLPPMIEDVLEAVRRLGQQFLWIDAYCIDQKDATEVQDTVRRMDDIYENSLLTICPFWTDTNGGLPGISVPLMRHEVRFLGSDIALYPKQQVLDIDSQFIDTPWHNRGWIFQESLLSRQRLIFLPSAVVPRCQEQSVSPQFLMSRQSKSTGRVTTDLELRSKLKTTEWTFEIYQKIVDNYSSRNLTFQSDALNAISGVLARMTAQTGMMFQQALPTEPLQLLNALLWFPETEAKDRSISRRAQVYLRRRLRFASWSWLGFEGPVYYPFWLIPRPHAEPSHEHFAIRVRRVSGLYIGWIMNGVESTTIDVSLLEVAGFEFKTNSDDENVTLSITTESASFPFFLSQGSPPKWTLALTRPQDKNYDSLTVSSPSSGLTRWSRQLSEIYKDRQLFNKLPDADGIVDIELLMLAHVNGPTYGDEVLAMAVARTQTADVVERLAIVAVPYACWELAEPELVTLAII
jgi:hypothetical protein